MTSNFIFLNIQQSYASCLIEQKNEINDNNEPRCHWDVVLMKRRVITSLLTDNRSTGGE